jgi:CRP/FNR family transcriptional regulator, cyclic AMP receptor protein
MQAKPLWYLENIDVTGIFCPKKQGAMTAETHSQRKYKRGDFIYVPNENSDKIYYLTEGRVKIGTYSNDAKELTKAILTQGEVFGELAIIGENKRRDFAYAMEDCEMCIITTTEMKDLFRNHNGLQNFFLNVFGTRTLEMEHRLESLVFRDSRERVVEFLIDLATQKGQKVGFDTLVKRFFSHQEIANMTATSRQTVTTVLNDLRDRKLLTFDRKRLLVRDMDDLRKEVK